MENETALESLILHYLTNLGIQIFSFSKLI
jgi:hypothetical protein